MGDSYLILTNPQHEHAYTGEQMASYRARYLIPYSIALAIYLYLSCLLETKVSLLITHTQKNMIKPYILVLFYQNLNLKYSSVSFSPNQKYNQLFHLESSLVPCCELDLVS